MGSRCGLRRLRMCVVMVLVAAGLVFFGMAWRESGRVGVSGDAFRMPVDLSKVGTYRVEVVEGNPAGWVRVLRVRVKEGVDGGAELDEAMKGLGGEVVAVGKDGKEFHREALDWRGSGWGGRGMLGSEVSKGSRGEYVLTVEVKSPAVGMGEMGAHEIVGIHEHREVEGMGVLIKGAMGIGCWVVAGLVILR